MACRKIPSLRVARSLEYAQQLSADRPDAAGIHHSRASNDAVKLHVSMTADDRAQRPA